MGIYTAVGLSLVFTGWLFLANRVPFLDRLALERNIAAAVVLCLFALIPSFDSCVCPTFAGFRLVAWLIFQCVLPRTLHDFPETRRLNGAIQVFMYGAVVYLIVATLSWIGAAIWRVREQMLLIPTIIRVD